uniref:Uncharacterized protein n=1 Tax=Oryza sativa subsp. japonica TaxID=39947 RepID=Q6H5M9_ORYSJ|nr:hypothetical protein [Oryza sativa Japonica Group]BAD25970.1 hypothetical protein [Oryza sativa Japonica Group]
MGRLRTVGLEQVAGVKRGILKGQQAQEPVLSDRSRKPTDSAAAVRTTLEQIGLRRPENREMKQALQEKRPTEHELLGVCILNACKLGRKTSSKRTKKSLHFECLKNKNCPTCRIRTSDLRISLHQTTVLRSTN